MLKGASLSASTTFTQTVRREKIVWEGVSEITATSFPGKPKQLLVLS